MTYKEIDGLLYPEIDIGESRLRNLGRFGKARLEYLHSQCFGYYRELLISGKLAEHCEGYDTRGYELAESFRDSPVMLAATRLLHHAGKVFADNTSPVKSPVGHQIDRKLQRKIREKKMAQGHAEDDHEQTMHTQY